MRTLLHLDVNEATGKDIADGLVGKTIGLAKLELGTIAYVKRQTTGDRWLIGIEVDDNLAIVGIEATA